LLFLDRLARFGNEYVIKGFHASTIQRMIQAWLFPGLRGAALAII